MGKINNLFAGLAGAAVLNILHKTLKNKEPMELNPKPVAKTEGIKAMTVGYYLFGALVTALVACSFKSKESII